MTVRNVREDEAEILQGLANKCKPLDVHTIYTYWVICKYFNHISFVIENNNIICGYITAVENNDNVLIWQIGILEEYRGRGYSQILIDTVMNTVNTHKIVYVTIDKNNKSSNSAFLSYAEKSDKKLEQIGNLKLRGIDTSENEVIYKLS